MPILTQPLWPRYFCFPVIAIFMLLINGREFQPIKNNLLKIIVGVLLIFLLYDSISAGHDMMTLNRTRWQALDYLNLELKIDPKRIDGGLDYNIFHFYKYNFPKTKAKNWWWVYDDEYAVSIGRLPDYDIIRVYDYTRWFPPGFQGKIFVSKRK